MESRSQEIRAKNNSSIRINIIPGHFATNHSHINYYIDLTRPKCRQQDAKLAAEELASMFAGQQIDTIVCMDDTQMVAAFLAEQLSSTMNVNSGTNINVLVPEYNSNNQMIFRDNIQKMIWKKKVLLLIASATTGKTVRRSLECLNYYSGEIIGVGAIFSAIDEIDDIPVHYIFGTEDIPDYNTYSYRECPACAGGYKIDAIINSHGYSKI